MFAIFDIQEWLTLGLLSVIGLVALGLLVFLGVGLFQARSLIRREFYAYFLSPIAYVVMVVFLFVTGELFTHTVSLLTAPGPTGTQWPMQSMFAQQLFWFVFLFIPPLLTMRLFAEERSSGTLEMLMTAPLRDWQVVLCKYVACLAFYVVLWLPTLLYVPVLMGARMPQYDLTDWTLYRIVFLAGLAVFLCGGVLLLPRLSTPGRVLSLALLIGGGLMALVGGWLHYHDDPVAVIEFPITLADPRPVLTTYLGLFLAGAMFLALGLLMSSLVRDQMVAAIIALMFSLVFLAAGFWTWEGDGGLFAQVVDFFNVPRHFERDFTRGILDSRPLILYTSVTAFCLFLTVRSLESRRLRA